MGQPFDIVGYAYRADLYCGDCVVTRVADRYEAPDEILEGISYEADLAALAAFVGIADREDEYSFDSDDFPKVMFRDQAEDDNCSGCGAVLE